MMELVDKRSTFLPDFCNVRMIFVVVILAQLLSFILALGPHVATGERWIQLSLISLFVQWVALSNCAVLCILRPFVVNRKDSVVAIISFVTVMVLTLMISEASFIISRGFAISSLLPTRWHFEFLLRNSAISAIITIIALRHFYVQYKLQQSTEARGLAKLQALQARIRPHFLFNSMNTIASLTRTEPALAEEMVLDLADLFRVALQENVNEVTLAAELQLCRRYLNIEQTRLGERLQVEWKIDNKIEKVMVPALSLQPLLENAIYHGIEQRAEGGAVVISAYIKDKQLYLEVNNPLPPVSAKSTRASHHMALQNIRDRLSGLYGNQAKLKINQDNQEFKAIIIIPLRRSSESGNG